MNDDQQDNIEAAMDKVAESMTMSVSRNLEEDGEPSQKQVLLRASEREHRRWKQAAAVNRMSMAEFIRETMNREADSLLECQHPMSKRKIYPWSNICTACNTRLPLPDKKS